MSILKAWYVGCDRCGSPASVSTWNARDARNVSQDEDGFERIDKEDLCPRCAGKVWDGARWTKPKSAR